MSTTLQIRWNYFSNSCQIGLHFIRIGPINGIANKQDVCFMQIFFCAFQEASIFIVSFVLVLSFGTFSLQLFDGKEGRPKYPRRWVILPPFLQKYGEARELFIQLTIFCEPAAFEGLCFSFKDLILHQIFPLVLLYFCSMSQLLFRPDDV